jgi:hypothetical protein
LNAFPGNCDDNARSEVQMALLLLIEVFRDGIYCMAMSSFMDRSVVAGSYLQGLGPGLCLETSRPLIPHHRMRSFRLNYNRRS